MAGLKTKSRQPDGLDRILEAAREAFAAQGYEGASLRTISANAGVLHTAMLYHFKNKETLWKAVMTELFAGLSARRDQLAEEFAGADPSRFARAAIRDFVMFCAEHPELHRIMTNEGRAETDRMHWLVENHTRPFYEGITAMSASLSLRPEFQDPVRLYYAVIGLSASAFTLAPEFKVLSGRDPFAPDEVETTANLVEAIIFG